MPLLDSIWGLLKGSWGLLVLGDWNVVPSGLINYGFPVRDLNIPANKKGTTFESSGRPQSL